VILTDNLLTTLDLSKLVNLKVLWASYNNLLSLDVLANKKLEWLYAPENSMVSISGLEAIEDKNVTIDVSHNKFSDPVKAYLTNLLNVQKYEFLSF